MLSDRQLGFDKKVEGVLRYNYRERPSPGIFKYAELLVCWQFGGSEWTGIVADVI